MMRKQQKRMGARIARWILPPTCLALLTWSAHAHKPLMMVEDNENGTLTVTVGFSDGESGAGAPILLKARDGGEVLWEGALNARGELLCPKQSEPYTIHFIDDEPGHSAVRDGIVLQAGETAPALAAAVPARNNGGEAGAATGAAPHARQHKAACGAATPKGNELIPHPQWTLPPSADFTDEIMRLLADKTVSVRNVLGLARVTSLMQCLQYHAQNKMGALVSMAEEKVKAGRKVDFQLPQAGLCPGALSGFLATDFAIRELYGDEAPLMDDLRIECKGKMGGIWDAFELILGRRLSRERGVMGPSPDAFVFFAERLSDGRRIVFTYTEEIKARLARFFQGKINADPASKDEMRNVRQELFAEVMALHARKDTSYFRVLESGAGTSSQHGMENQERDEK